MGMIKVSEKLEGWLKLTGWSYADLAKAVNYDEGRICSILKGTEEPSKQVMKKIMDITCLGVELFYYDRNAKENNGGN